MNWFYNLTIGRKPTISFFMILALNVILIVLSMSPGIIVTTASAEEKIVRIVNPPWPPYYDAALPNYGAVPEIITAAYNRAGFTVQYESMSLLSKLFEDVDKGLFDGAATAYYTDERAKKYNFSDSYMDSPVVFYKLSTATVQWKTLEDLKAYKIVVLKDNSYSPEFDKADFLQKVVTINEKLSFRKLYLKEADLAIMDRIVGYFLIQNSLAEYQKDSFEALKPPLYVNKLYLMFSKNVPGIKDKIAGFNKGLKLIREDGTLKQILSKHGLTD